MRRKVCQSTLQSSCQESTSPSHSKRARGGEKAPGPQGGPTRTSSVLTDGRACPVPRDRGDLVLLHGLTGRSGLEVRRAAEPNPAEAWGWPRRLAQDLSCSGKQPRPARALTLRAGLGADQPAARLCPGSPAATPHPPHPQLGPAAPREAWSLALPEHPVGTLRSLLC